MNRGFYLGIFLGAVIGALAGMAFAPSQGMETRRRWTEKGKEAADYIAKAAGNVLEKTSTVEEKIKQAM
jgi:gas vesicle protein